MKREIEGEKVKNKSGKQAFTETSRHKERNKKCGTREKTN